MKTTAYVKSFNPYFTGGLELWCWELWCCFGIMMLFWNYGAAIFFEKFWCCFGIIMLFFKFQWRSRKEFSFGDFHKLRKVNLGQFKGSLSRLFNDITCNWGLFLVKELTSCKKIGSFFSRNLRVSSRIAITFNLKKIRSKEGKFRSR